MKYSKQAVVDLIEKKLESIRDEEERAYQSRVRAYEESVKNRKDATERVNRWLDSLFERKHSKPSDYQKIREELGEQRVYYSEKGISHYLAIAAGELSPPEKSTKGSDHLADVLEVFKTGAPPEVTVNDLRGFGLLDFVKYQGGR